MDLRARSLLVFLLSGLSIALLGLVFWAGWAYPRTHKEYDALGRLRLQSGKKLTYSEGELRWALAGHSVVYDANGKMRESGVYRNGKRIDDWRVFDDTGRLVRIQVYDNGSVVKEVQVHPDGTMGNPIEFSL